MISHMNEEISVITIYDADTRSNKPVVMKWRGKKYKIEKVAFYHPVRIGRVLHHVYSVSAGAMDYRLDLNSENQNWLLTEASDGFAD